MRGRGRPLPPSLRHGFDHELAHALGDVRLHSGEKADAAARSIGAAAYTVGQEIVFGRDRLRPETEDGRGLLRHELSHVVRQGGGSPAPRLLARDDHPAPPEGSVQRQPVTDVSPALTEPDPWSPAASFDPHAIDVGALTNADFLVEVARVDTWLAGNSEAGPERAAYVILRDRLAVERHRRVAIGHSWMQGGPPTLPTALVGVVPSADGTPLVTQADMSAALGPPADLRGARLLRPEAFLGKLWDLNVPTIDAETWARIQVAREATAESVEGLAPEAGVLGVTSGRRYLPRFGSQTEWAFANRLSKGWHGAFAEAWFGLGQRPFSVRDLNRRGWVDAWGNVQRGNYPVMDWAPWLYGRGSWLDAGMPSLFGRRFTSVKAGSLAYVLGGHAEMLGTHEPHKQRAFLRNNPRMSPADVARLGDIAIYPEMVESYRQNLRNPRGIIAEGERAFENWEKQPFRRVYDGYLRHLEGTQYHSFEELDTARRSGAITEAEFFDTLSRAGALAAESTTSHGMPEEIGTQLREVRGRMGDRPAVRMFGAGEFLSETYWGGGARGTLAASGAAGAWGGTYGGLIAVAFEGGVMLIDPQEHPDWESELGLAATKGALGGGAGGMVEQVAGARLLGLGAGGGRLAALGMRSGLGGLGGGAGGLVVETLDIAMEPGTHTPEEVVLREGRAFVIGAASGVAGAAAGTILTSAIAGTAMGTAFPVVGNVIGFLAGLTVGIVIAAGLSAVIPTVPRGFGSSVDSQAAADARRRLEERPMPPGCFAEDTLIRLTSGRGVAIADVRTGDRVIAFDERDGRLASGLVTAVRRHGPRPILAVRMAGATRPLRVTPEHAVFTGGAWAPAGSLTAGSTLARLDGDPGRVERADVLAVEPATPVPVVSLTVDGAHTYFADGVLVHNLKLL